MAHSVYCIYARLLRHIF